MPSGPAPADTVGRGRRILGNTLYRSIAEVGARLGALVLFAALARAVGEGQFGLYVLAISIVSVVTVLGDFGQEIVLAREVARDHRAQDRYFANTLGLRLALSFPLVLVTAALAFALDIEPAGVILLLGLGTVADLLTKVCFGMFQAYEHLSLMPVVLVPQRWLTAIVGIGVLALGGGIVEVSAVYVASSVLALALAVYLMRRDVAKPALKVDLGAWVPLLRLAAPVGVAGVVYIVLLRGDAAILALFEPPEVVGRYGSAYRLLESTFFVSWSVTAAIFPVLARRSAGEGGLLFGRSLKLALLVVTPAAAVAASLSAAVMGLFFGEPFEAGADTLALLAPAMLLYPVSYLATFSLIAEDRAATVWKIFAVAAVVNVAGNFALIPVLSDKGAALMAAVTEMVVAALAVATLVRGGRGFDPRRPSAAALVGGLAAVLVMVLLGPALLPALPAGLVVYAAAAFAVERRFYPDDLTLFAALLRRGPRPSTR